MPFSWLLWSALCFMRRCFHCIAIPFPPVLSQPDHGHSLDLETETDYEELVSCSSTLRSSAASATTVTCACGGSLSSLSRQIQTEGGSTSTGRDCAVSYYGTEVAEQRECMQTAAAATASRQPGGISHSLPSASASLRRQAGDIHCSVEQRQRQRHRQ